MLRVTFFKTIGCWELCFSLNRETKIVSDGERERTVNQIDLSSTANQVQLWKATFKIYVPEHLNPIRAPTLQIICTYLTHTYISYRSFRINASLSTLMFPFVKAITCGRHRTIICLFFSSPGCLFLRHIQSETS